MENFFINIIKHYYWFLVIVAASLIFGVRDTSSLLIVVTVLVTIFCLSSIQWNLFDGLVFVFLLYSLVSYLFVDYAYLVRLYYLGVRSEIIPALFYFIARSSKFKSDEFFENMKLPLLFAMICGMFFYFFSPVFYITYKMNVIWNAVNADVDELSGYLLYEMTRLSSFWPHSYFIGYSSLFLFIYASKKIIVDNCYKKIDIACFALSFFCLFFAQQRVSIAFCLLYFVLLTACATLKNLPSKNHLYLLWLTAIIFGVMIFIIAILVIGTDFVEYILDRSINYKGNMIVDRFDLFKAFFSRLSFWGEGLGKYGHGAVEFGFVSVPDCDYIRVPSELGFVGLGMLMSICLISLIKGFNIFKYAIFEVCCLSFCLVAMLGAAPWELGTLQPFLYWFCIGHIQSKYDRKNELEEEYQQMIASQKERNENNDDGEEPKDSEKKEIPAR